MVIAVRNLPASAASATALGLPFVHEDPAVAAFGAVNSLHAAGDTFVELLAEGRPGSAVGRHVSRLGGDGGYMVIAQVDDLDAHLARVEAADVRVIWQGGVEGIRAAHLHPRDVGSTILSLDQADPPEAWPWCGPDWTGRTPDVTGAPIAGVTLTATDPAATAIRWAQVLDAPASGAAIELSGTRIDFVPADDRPDRLVAVQIPGIGDHDLGGVRLHG